MAEIINLRQARKRKSREEKANHAAANRLKFGMNKAERRRQEAQGKLDKKRLDSSVRSTVDPKQSD